MAVLPNPVITQYVMVSLWETSLKVHVLKWVLNLSPVSQFQSAALQYLAYRAPHRSDCGRVSRPMRSHRPRALDGSLNSSVMASVLAQAGTVLCPRIQSWCRGLGGGSAGTVGPNRGVQWAGGASVRLLGLNPGVWGMSEMALQGLIWPADGLQGLIWPSGPDTACRQAPHFASGPQGQKA